MAKRTGGFIGQDGINAPDPATGVSGTAGDGQVDVSFTSPSDVGGAAITEYRVTDSTGAFGATGSSSPITVTGLTNDTSYTFNVWAINPFGWSSPSDASGGVTPAPAPRGLFYGGSSPQLSIEYVTITSTGNATDFGDSAIPQYTPVGGVSSSTRGILAGGADNSSSGFRDTIHYVTIATTGNATTFGDLTTNARFAAGGSSSTRGVRLAGQTSSSASSHTNVIDYVTIATTGNATDFGDTTVSTFATTGVSSPTRIVRCGADSGDVMDYITTASTGNATNFGDLYPAAATTGYSAGCSSSTRGVIASMYPSDSQRIEYITIASTGNSTNFGNLTRSTYAMGATSDSLRGLFAGGTSGSGIDYVTIATTGNAADFGDLLSLGVGNSGFSNAHGGLS